MGSTLAQIETRAQNFLMDATAAIWPVATLDEAIRLALQEFTQSLPLAVESVITLPGAGREIALNSLTDLLDVSEVWWPYSSTGAEVWPPNRVHGFRLWWDDAQPVLHLTDLEGGQPQLGDEMRVWWTKPQTIQNLDGAAVSTLRAVDETLIVLGAAGHACFARSVDVSETSGSSTTSTPNLAALGTRFLKEFRFLLEKQRPRSAQAPATDPFGPGWKLDQWDEQ